MRNPIFAAALMVALSGAARAQVIDLTPMNTFGYEDGSGETAWKLSNPSGSQDWFSVDFGGDAAGTTMAAVWADSASTGVATPGVAQSIGYTQSSLATGQPDLGAATMKAAAVPVTDGFNSDTGYATACLDPGSDFHVLYQQTPGDSETWLIADTNGPVRGRSWFSSTSYASPGTQAGFNLRMGYAGWAGSLDGTLLINGGASASVSQVEDACLTFSACSPGVLSALYLCTPVFFGPLVPPSLTRTGHPLIGGPCPDQWTICITLTCRDQAGGPFGFCCLYADPCDLKPSGKPRVKVSTTASLTITCAPSCGSCFGQRDDGSVDAYVWKISSVAGTGDWFNVNHGAPGVCDNVTSLTGVEIMSWDFCGSGPCWAEVGVYPDDGSGTPDITMGSAGANPCMAPGAGDITYPATYYDVPDVPAGTNEWHVAAKWPAGDTCIWLGSDTDGTDSTCGTPIPSLGMTSGFTASDYSTGMVGISFANWCMKLDWN